MQSSHSPSVNPDRGCLLTHERNPFDVNYLYTGSTFGVRDTVKRRPGRR